MTTHTNTAPNVMLAPRGNVARLARGYSPRKDTNHVLCDGRRSLANPSPKKGISNKAGH